mmetsp:Transcript_13301/g.32475  ORF Transcript_13301/g.32475 Transcript_13301/m.32475 type:complete len:203 (-) Transcript_13301:1866-2474(-)
MCPGRAKSVTLAFGLANRLTVLARSVALIPVVIPCSFVASTVTVKAVPFGSSLFCNIGGSPSSSIRSPSIAMQMTPLEYLTIFAISSGVQASAAIIRSPSFSRSMSSTTTTIFPSRTASTASSTDFRPKQYPSPRAVTPSWDSSSSTIAVNPSSSITLRDTCTALAAISSPSEMYVCAKLGIFLVKNAFPCLSSASRGDRFV